MIKLPHKPRFYISIKAKDNSYFFKVAKELLFKKYGTKMKFKRKRTYSDRYGHGHAAGKKAGIMHKLWYNPSGDWAVKNIFWCPLDYGRELEECVKKALDFYCDHRKDKPHVRTEIKGNRKGKCGKKNIRLRRGRYKHDLFSSSVSA